jgi:hypothetical protein
MRSTAIANGAILQAHTATLEQCFEDGGRISMIEQAHNSSALACDLSAIAPQQRAAHESLAKQLLTEAAQETEELADGYAFRFPAEQYLDVAAFIANERLCCPFFTFALEVTADQGPLWLRITGREGVKDILQGALLG